MSASGSPTYKTVIQLSSAARRPRTGSDPLAYGSNKQRKTSTSSVGKQVSALSGRGCCEDEAGVNIDRVIINHL